MSIDVMYFMRHGETEMNREMRCQGRIDIPLNEEGRKQAEKAATFFRDVRIDRIYASTLSRAVASAELVAKAKELPVENLEWLAEIDHGELEGMNREEADEQFPGLLDIWINRPHEADFPGGESLNEVALRVRQGLLEVYEQVENGTVLFVTHQIISSVARCLLLGQPLSKVWEDKLVNGDHFCFELTPARIKRLNDWES